MARTPLFPRGGDFTSWALTVTQRIERDYAELKNIMVEDDDLRSLSAAIVTNITSVSSAINTDIHSISAVLATDFYSNDASVYAVAVSDNASLYALVGADLRSLSVDLDAAIRSTSFVIKQDITSVAADIVAGTYGGAVFATDLRSVSADIQLNSIDPISNTVSILAVFIHGSLSTAEALVHGSLSTAEAFVRGSLSSAEVYLRGSISNTISVIAANLNAVSNTVSILAAQVVNVKAPPYNATGDGATDDTAAVKAALVASAGKILYFPPGQYKLYGGLTLTAGSVHMMGAGMQSSELTWAATATSVGIFLYGTDADHFHHVSDLRLSTSKDGGTALTFDYTAEIVSVTGGIHITLDRVAPRFIAERLYILGVGAGDDPTVNNWYGGIEGIAAVNATIRDCNIVCAAQSVVGGWRAKDANRYAINYYGSPITTDNGHPIVLYVTNCNITYPFVGVNFLNVEGCFVLDNNIIFGDQGVVVNSTTITGGSVYHHPQLSCLGNHINMFTACVDVEGQVQITIADNLFYGSQSNVNGVGVNIHSDATEVVVCHNQFESWGTSGWIGVNMFGDNGIISDNLFKQNTTSPNSAAYPIVLGAASSNVKGSNNLLQGTWTGGKVVLDSGTGNTVNEHMEAGTRQANISVAAGQLVTISFSTTFDNVIKSVVASPMNSGTVTGDDWVAINSYSLGGFILRYNLASTISNTGTRSVHFMAFGH